MRYSSKSSVFAVAALLAGAAVFGSACGGSGGDDRGSPGAGAGNATAGGGAPGSGGAVAGGGAPQVGGGAGGTTATTCDSSTTCCKTTTCSCPYPQGDGTTDVIANMEDNKTQFLTATIMNAKGYWDFSRDASMGTIMPTGNATLAPVDGGANGTLKSMHVSGTGLTLWGAALAAELSNGCPFDASKYGGISFYAKGTSNVIEGMNKLLVLVGNPEYIPASSGGFCDDKATMPADQNCYARHRVTIDLTPDWKQYIIAWDDLKAPTYLTTGKPFGPNRIRDIVFNASGPAGDATQAVQSIGFDFYVDELKFEPTGVKGNVTSTTGGAGAGAGGGSGTAGTGGGAAAGAGGTAGGAAAGTGGAPAGGTGGAN